MASFLALLTKQDELQRETFGFAFEQMTDDQRMEYIRWNMLALQDELHEAMQETGWKPWASSSHLNIEPYLGEMVDALHFFMNLLLVTGVRPDQLAQKFTEIYLAKWQRNVERQAEGYTGVKEKCPVCGRDLTETTLSEIFDIENGKYDTRCVCGTLLWISDVAAV
jgi:hypothetical protein